jgi:hypothetical protein
MVLVNFPYRFVSNRNPRGPLERAADDTLRRRVKDDRAVHTAVLAWLVAGARRWYATGTGKTPLPAAVAADTADWRSQADPITSYVSEHLVLDPDGWIPAPDLRNHFSLWLAANNKPQWSAQLFSDRMSAYEWVTGDFVSHKKVKTGPRRATVSQAPAGSISGRTLGTTEWAWVGMRFRTPQDPDPDVQPPQGPPTVQTLDNNPPPSSSYDQLQGVPPASSASSVPSIIPHVENARGGFITGRNLRNQQQPRSYPTPSGRPCGALSPQVCGCPPTASDGSGANNRRCLWDPATGGYHVPAVPGDR